MKTEKNKLTSIARASRILLAFPLLVCATALDAHAQKGRRGSASSRRRAPAVKTVAYYSCPMHPDVKATKKTARCPKCGMDLRPVYKEEADSHEEEIGSPLTVTTTSESPAA